MCVYEIVCLSPTLNLPDIFKQICQRGRDLKDMLLQVWWPKVNKDPFYASTEEMTEIFSY